VGSVLAFSSIVAATFVTGDNPHSHCVALLMGGLTGALLGLISDCIIAYLKIPPFVATLGMLSVARGLTYAYTGGMPVPNLSESFLSLGEGSFPGVPVPVLNFYWSCHPLGRAESRRQREERSHGGHLCEPRYRFCLCHCWAARSTWRIDSNSEDEFGTAPCGVSYELDAIAAVVIGGTSLSGGVGSIAGNLLRSDRHNQ